MNKCPKKIYRDVSAKIADNTTRNPYRERTIIIKDKDESLLEN